jgi:malonate transporter
MKLIFVPLAITLGGYFLGFRNMELGVLYLMSASPAAAASHPMAQAMKGNHYLAAAIIAVTSVGSMVFTTLGIFLLRVSDLI